MGTLRDEVYEKLDYLSQLTEIVVSPHNEVLGRLPDRLELNFDDIRRLKYKTWSYRPSFELSLRNILMKQLQPNEQQYLDDLMPHFELQASQDLELDIHEGTMVGTVCLVKLNPQIEEKKLLEMAVDRANNEINSYSWSGKKIRDRLITVLNTLESGAGTAWAQGATGRLAYSGCSEIRKQLSSLILDNKWRIRDSNTIIKVGQWINSYLTNGDEVGLMNLLKLKIMVDKDLPIYSVDEVKNANPA